MKINELLTTIWMLGLAVVLPIRSINLAVDRLIFAVVSLLLHDAERKQVKFFINRVRRLYYTHTHTHTSGSTNLVAHSQA